MYLPYLGMAQCPLFFFFFGLVYSLCQWPRSGNTRPGPGGGMVHGLTGSWSHSSPHMGACHFQVRQGARRILRLCQGPCNAPPLTGDGCARAGQGRAAQQREAPAQGTLQRGIWATDRGADEVTQRHARLGAQVVGREEMGQKPKEQALE